VKEQSEENLLRDKKVYEPPRFMSISQCIDQLCEVESVRKESLITEETICVGLARVGKDDEKVMSGTIKSLRQFEFGPPLHSFVVPGNLHELEKQFLDSILTANSK